ncbi:Hypothetical predicted protein [Olea europaea subsp. europaea]|uniref:Uncharacterized protein n=3 Tax=Olea europaea subsp. europaea TaxID=158383 RepID=A0A8S0S0Z3_OLEEU|nr:Hypothetical predicted protein [Olea europaea subsp. europaea]
MEVMKMIDIRKNSASRGFGKRSVVLLKMHERQPEPHYMSPLNPENEIYVKKWFDEGPRKAFLMFYVRHAKFLHQPNLLYSLRIAFYCMQDILYRWMRKLTQFVSIDANCFCS